MPVRSSSTTSLMDLIYAVETKTELHDWADEVDEAMQEDDEDVWTL